MSEHLYIHIPFCLKKCGYCDFYSQENLSRLPQFVGALKKEIRIRAAGKSPYTGPVKTIYFGGGTPSLLSPKELGTILETIGEVYPVSPRAEITVEANPGTVDAGYFAGIKQVGVNRLSLGIQSFNPEKLRFLGRSHSVGLGRRAIEQARDEGFDNIGLDLIYGVPGESARELRRELAAALVYRPEHLSCYMLTLESGTPLYERARAGGFTPMPSLAKADLFSITAKALEEGGFTHYEISNFARGGHRVSRHNSAYWQMTPYTGFGPSAHSYFNEADTRDGDRPVRAWNVSDLEGYIRTLEQGLLPVAEQEGLSLAQQMVEMIMVGLRTLEGVDLNAFDALSKVRFKDRFSDLIKDLGAEDLGHVCGRGGYFSLTLRGWCRLDSIVESFAGQIL